MISIIMQRRAWEGIRTGGQAYHNTDMLQEDRLLPLVAARKQLRRRKEKKNSSVLELVVEK